MSGRDHENWTTKFDCICYQNFSLKTKFFLDFLFILTTLVGFTQLTKHMLYMFKFYTDFMYTKHRKTLYFKFIFKVVTKYRKML